MLQAKSCEGCRKDLHSERALLSHLIKRHDHMALMRTNAGEDESEQIWNAGGKYLKLTIPACGSALTFAEKFAGAQSYAALPSQIHFRKMTKA